MYKRRRKKATIEVDENGNVKQEPVNEHKLQAQIVKLFRMYGFRVINTDVMIALRFIRTQRDRVLFIQSEKIRGYSNGQPDLIVYNEKGIFFIELKTTKGQLRLEQKEQKKDIESLGYKYIVLRSTEECLEFINANR